MLIKLRNNCFGEKCPLTISPSLSKDRVTIIPELINIDMEYLKQNHKSIINNLNTHYRIPQELSQLDEVVSKVASYWHSLNLEYADYYFCYLSVSQSNVPPTTLVKFKKSY